jgi:hypothetical protein
LGDTLFLEEFELGIPGEVNFVQEVVVVDLGLADHF